MLSPRLARILLIAVAAGWVCFWASSAFINDLDGILLSMLILGGLLLATLLLLIDSIVTGIRGRGWRRLLLAAGMAVLLVWPGWPLVSGLQWLSAAALLRSHQQEYEPEALAVLALPEDQAPPRKWYRDAGPPRRVALCLGGITDNWSGFVYDPSRTFEDAPVMVFGGKLISNTHMWGPWYYVVFT